MANFRYTVEIFAPPQQVWDTLIDVERWPAWTPTVLRVERLDSGPLALGSRTKLWQPQLMAAAWQVTELDPVTGLFTWQTGRPGVRVTGIHRVEAAPKSVTRLTLELNYGGLLGPLLARQLKALNWDYLTKEGQGLKARCEEFS